MLHSRGWLGVLAAWSTHPFFMWLRLLIVGQLGSQGLCPRRAKGGCILVCSMEGVTKASQVRGELWGGVSIPLLLTFIYLFLAVLSAAWTSSCGQWGLL